MSFLTARQLQELHRNNGHVAIPRAARLTPLAADWLKAKRISVVYEDGPNEKPASAHEADKREAPIANLSASGDQKFLWWCDGPCGVAKAALMAESRESALSEIEISAERGQAAAVIRELAKKIKTSQISGGILVVQSGAVAMVAANRCSSLRAVLGTCLDSVEQAMRQVAANVLVIEYPYQTIQQVRNMVGRFVRAKRELPDEMRRQLKELMSCG